MIRSRRRPVVFPQAEHARLAGAIALAWGNEAFARPPVPFDSLVRGVTLHDRGYGELDADGIGEVPRDRWLAIQAAGAAPRGHDPVADLVVALHIHRLVSGGDENAPTPVREALPELHRAAGIDERDAREADRVTDLCDRIAFEFCWEEPASGRVAIAATRGSDPVEVAYAVDGEGLVTVEPWPLAVPRLVGLVLGYVADAYPDVLEPVVVPFEVRPSTNASA